MASSPQLAAPPNGATGGATSRVITSRVTDLQTPPAQMQRIADKFVDACLATAILITPLLLGGRSAWAHLLLAVCGTTAAVAWGTSKLLQSESRLEKPAFFRCGLTFVLLAAITLFWAQLLPMKAWALAVVSPELSQLLPQWSGDVNAFGRWKTISLAPAETRTSLILMVSISLLFLVCLERIRNTEDAGWLLRLLAISTLGLAILGLLQYAFNNGKYFWVFDYPYTHKTAGIRSTVVGSFTNRNHFAQMMALGMGPLVWWIYVAYSNRQTAEKQNKRRSHQAGWDASPTFWSRLGVSPTVAWRIAALVLCAFAGLMTLSRGGSITIVLTLVAMLAVGYGCRIVNTKTAVGVTVGVVCLACILSFFGAERIGDRLADFSSAKKLDPWQTRQKIWVANLAAFQAFPLLGTGAGSHQQVIPVYYAHFGDGNGATEYTHAENGYLQIASECGTAGLLLLLSAFGVIGWWLGSSFLSIRKHLTARSQTAIATTKRDDAVLLAVVVGMLTATLFHSLVDFVWYIPACLIPVMIAAAIAFRLAGWSKAIDPRRSAGATTGVTTGVTSGAAATEPSPWFAKPVFAACVAVVAMVGLLQIKPALQAARAEATWFAYARLSFAEPPTEAAEQLQRTNQMIIHLEEVLRLQPNHPFAPSRLAALYLRRFELPDGTGKPVMGLSMVRDAVVASEFQSEAEMRGWLENAFGQRVRYLDAANGRGRQALRRCPLQGEVYLYLEEVNFLAKPSTPLQSQSLFEQALRVRPHDGRILIAAGQDRILAGEIELGLQHWGKAFHAGDAHQQRLLDLVAGKIPVELLYEKFQPTTDDLEIMVAEYERRELTEEIDKVRGLLASQCEADALQAKGAASAKLWATAAKAYSQMGKSADCARCLAAGLAEQPSSYPLRRSFGMCLYALGKKDLAKEHLAWCLERQPADEELRVMYDSVATLRLETR